MTNKQKNILRGMYAGVALGYFAFGRPILGTTTLAIWGIVEYGFKQIEKEEPNV